MYAIQRDRQRIIDTLLVTINASDGRYMAHRHNAIAVAAAADMGVIGMKVFADAAYYHKDAKFSNSTDDVYHGIGSQELPSGDLIRYALSVDGINTIIVGIGHIDDKPGNCQLEQNLGAAQVAEPLDRDEMTRIEKMVTSAGKDSANTYFQRKAIGLTAPRNVGAEEDSSMPALSRNAIRVSWDTAYAGTEPIERYEVLRDDELVGSIPHTPQITGKRYHYDDIFNEHQKDGVRHYKVRAVDASGNSAESLSLAVDFHCNR